MAKGFLKLGKGQSCILLAFGCLVSNSAILNETRGKTICGGFRGFNAYGERERSDTAELDTVRVSRSPTTVITADGEVQTNEEATVSEAETEAKKVGKAKSRLFFSRNQSII